ncbi:MAG: hypothetical protein RLW87_10890 [Alphaproteobacteria bacterium]
MKRFRQLDGIGGWARNLALFALLLQFTLPLGMAVAADLPGAQFDPSSVFDCYGGDSDGSDTGHNGLHGCVLPGGCCIAGGSVSLGVTLANGTGTAIAAVFSPAYSQALPVRPAAQNLVRGPPDTSA